MTDAVLTPPHAVDAEQALLGACLIDPALIDTLSLAPEDFYRSDHQTLWRHLRSMAAAHQAIDSVTVCESMDPETLERASGPGYVVHLANEAMGRMHRPAYAALVRDKARLRDLIRISEKLREHAFGGRFDSGLLLDQAVSRLLGMQVSDQRYAIPIRDAMTEGYRRLEQAAESEGIVGITSGLDRLDDQLGGWQDQDLYVIGGRPGTGKTALMCGFALAAGIAGKPIGMVSAEQPAHQIAMRQAASLGRVDFKHIRTGRLEVEEWPRLTAGMNTLSEFAGYEIWDRPAPDISEVAAQARLWKKGLGIKLLFVDYLQRMTCRGHDNRAYEIGAVARGLKEIARELDIPVVVLAQLSRTVDNKGWKYIPVIADLKDSGEIEQEADCILMLTRPEATGGAPDNMKGLAQLAVRKNRHGPLGITTVAFVGKYLRFDNCSGREEFPDD